MIQLTDEQRAALRETPPRIQDPRTKVTYVLLPEDVYTRLSALLSADPELDPSHAYPLADETFREDWNDPKMAEYDRYEEHKR